MPDIDGFGVCRKLKASELTANIPIIFLSALNEIDDKLQGLKIGAVDYITKPFSPKEVLARVRVHIALRLQQNQLEQLHKHDQQYFAKVNAIQEEVLDQMQHDIKTPLSSIRASTYLIKRHSVKGTSHIDGYTNRINHAVDEAINVMESLLKVARLETGDSLQFKSIEIKPFMQKIVAVYQALAESRDIKLHAHIQARSAETASVDPWQINRVISNLLSNALKYTPSGGTVKLWVGLTRNSLHLNVSDTGRGIPEKHLDKIFDRFHRVPADTDDIEGLGLGLYIVKSIVQRHGGTIHVQSKEHQGSIFVISIPRNQEAVVAESLSVNR